MTYRTAKSRSRHVRRRALRPQPLSVGFDANVIVDCNPQLLFTSEVPLGCLHARVPEEKLDLLTLTARDVT
jgi:hypothetical protein